MSVCPGILDGSSVLCPVFLAVGIRTQISAGQNCLGLSLLLLVPSFCTFLVLCPLQLAPCLLSTESFCSVVVASGFSATDSCLPAETSWFFQKGMQKGRKPWCLFLQVTEYAA